MNTNSARTLCVLAIINSSLMAQVVVDFEELTLEPNSVVAAVPEQLAFESQGIQFHGSWEFDCCSFGWSYSNQNDLTTTGFTNSHSAYSLPKGGGALESSTFAVMNQWTAEASQIDLPNPTEVLGMYVTNTTYAYHAIASGDDGNEQPFVKGAFSDGDFFRLDIHGLDSAGNQVGSVDFLLADFVEENTGVVSEWTWVDLTSLGQSVSALQFNLSSTDNGDFGMNTPGYFAMDQLTVANVPEPSLNWISVMIIVGSLRMLTRRTSIASRT